MEIILIAAMAANRTIGRGNAIPWNIPGEQARFKKITMGSPLIMGRKTRQSIGHALPGRKNIVLTTNREFTASGAVIVHSLQQAYAACNRADRVFIIGGAQLYTLTLNRADTILLSILDQAVAGDTFFPEFSCPPFMLTHEERVEQRLPYTIRHYSRK